ncbi:hypothetical protein D9M71_550640 [compost metagenome]
MHEVVPLRDGDAEPLFHRLRIEASVVRDLDCTRGTVEGDSQCVVTHHAHGSRRRGSSQGAVAGGGQQQIAIDLIIALEHRALSCAGQRPELATTFEHARGFQLVASYFGEVPVELQHFMRLHGVVAIGDHRQRRLGVRAIEHLLLREGVDGAQVAGGSRFEVDRAFQDLPIHTGFTLPDLNGLLSR